MDCLEALDRLDVTEADLTSFADRDVLDLDDLIELFDFDLTSLADDTLLDLFFVFFLCEDEHEHPECFGFLEPVDILDPFDFLDPLDILDPLELFDFFEEELLFEELFDRLDPVDIFELFEPLELFDLLLDLELFELPRELMEDTDASRHDLYFLGLFERLFDLDLLCDGLRERDPTERDLDLDRLHESSP